MSDGTRQTSSQLLTGANWTAPGGKLGLRADYEQSLGGNDENTDFPTLLRLGADYKLSSRISLFADRNLPGVKMIICKAPVPDSGQHPGTAAP